MKATRFLVALAIFVVHVAALAEENIIDTDLNVGKSSSPTLTIDGSSVTNYYTGKYTSTAGTTKQLNVAGGGTAVFNNPANTISCTISITKAVVRFDVEGSSGTATLYLTGGASASNVKQFQFNAENATFPNNFSMAGSSSNQGYEYQPLKFLKSCTYSGNIANNTGANKPLEIIDDLNERPTVSFTGEINSLAGPLSLAPSGTFELRGKVSANTLYLSETNVCSNVGTAELWNPANNIALVSMLHQNLRLAAADVLTNATIYLGKVPSAYTNTVGLADLIVDADQHIKALTSSTSIREMRAGVVRASDNVTITVEGLASDADCSFAFAGPISLVKTGESLTQRFSRRNSTMTGSIIVSNGTFQIATSAKFPNASAVRVENGLLDLNVAAPFSTLQSVSIGSTGRIASSDSTRLTIETENLEIGGQTLLKGLYTSATHPANIGEGITIKCNKKGGLTITFR